MASMKDLNRMLKRGGKTTRKIPLKAGSWLANATKSVGLSSLDIIRDLMPNTAELGQSAIESADDIKSAIQGLGTQKGKLKNAFNASVYADLGRQGLKNALEDLKSGDFYNERRYQENVNKAMGLDDDEDFDFGDEDFNFDDEDFDVNLDSDDDGASVSVSRSHKGRNEATKITMVNNIGPDSPLVQATEFQTKIAVKSTEVLLDANAANTHATMAMISKVGGDQLKLTNAVHETLVDFSQSMQKQFSNFTAVSEKYYNDSISLQTRIADTLDQIRQNTAVGAGAAAAKDPRDIPDMLDLFSGGFINIGEYKKYVKKNVANWVDSNMMASSIKNVMEDTDTIQSIVAAPLRFLGKGIAEQFIPAMVQASMDQFDKMLGEAAITKLTQLGSYANRFDNPIMSFLGQIFGIQTEMRTTIDKRNYEKGPVPFDGATRRAIVDVIPTYLRQIASAVTGKEEFVFDYDQGVYRSLSSVQKEHKDNIRRAKLTEYSDDISEFTESIKKTFTAASKEQISEMTTAFEKTLERLVEVGGIPNYRATVNRSGEVTDPLKDLLESAGYHDENTLNAIRGFLEANYRSGEGYKNAAIFGSKSIRSRQNVNRLTAEREADPFRYNDIYIDNGLRGVDNATMRMATKPGERTRVSQDAGPDADQYGRRPTYYLRGILQTLASGIDVRVVNWNPPGGRGRRGRRGGGGGSPTTPRNPYLDELEVDRLNYQREKESEYAATHHAISDEEQQTRVDSGMLNLNDTLSPEQIQAAMDRVANERVVRERNQKRKPSILERAAGMGGTIGKWAQSLNDRAEKASGVVQSAFQTGNDILYKLVFGDEKGRKGLGAAFDMMFAGIKIGFRKLGSFIDKKILAPLDEALFGDNGLFTKFKESEFYKEITGKLKNAKDRVSKAIFGEKVTGSDGKVHYEGGLISSTMNELKNVGRSLGDAIFGKKGPDGKRVPLDQDTSILGNIKRAGKSLGDQLKDYLGIERDEHGKTKPFGTIVSEGMDSIWKHTKSRFNEWTNMLLGEPSIGDNVNNARDLFDNFRTEMKGKGGKIGAGAVMGAVATPIISSQLGILGSMFLPGGPIGGALLGAGISFVSQSETLKTKLFGEKDESGNRTGGLITKEFQDFFKDHKTGIGIGLGAGVAANLGLIPSLFVPGGPIGGAFSGAGLAMVKRAGIFNDILYGPGGTKEDPSGGLLGKVKNIFGKNKDFKGLALDASMGAGLGIMGSFFLPGGPIVGAMLGAAANIGINTEKFKTLLFGEEEVDEKGNKTGKRKGGLFGKFTDYLDKQIFTPLKKTAEIAQANFLYFMEDKIFRPLATAMAPITNKFAEFGEGITNGFKAMFKSIGEKFHNTVTKPIGEAIDKWLIQPIKNIAGKLFNAFTTVAGAIISAPFSLIGAVGQGIYSHDKRRGRDRATRDELSKVGSMFSGSYREAGGGFRGLLAGLRSGGGQFLHAFSSDVRGAGEFGPFGARYATATDNPETLDKKLKQQARDKWQKRLAEINDKYGGTDARTARALKKAKPGTPAGIQKEINEQRQTVNSVDDNVAKMKDASDAEYKRNEERHKSLLDKLNEVRDAITGKFRPNVGGDIPPRPDYSGRDITGFKFNRGPKMKSAAHDAGKMKDPSYPSDDHETKMSDFEAKQSKRSKRAEKYDKAQARRSKGLASDVSDIADSVHGQLNGLGKNVYKIYRLLLNKLGGSDSDYDGANNKEYMGLGGKIRTMLNNPVKFLKNLILSPFTAISDAFHGIVDTITSIPKKISDAVGGLVNALGTAASAVVNAGLKLLNIPVYLVKAGYEVVKNLAPAVGTVLVESAKIAGSAVIGAGKLLFKGINGLANVLVNAASGFGQLLGSALGGLGQLLVGAGIVGKDILKGVGFLAGGIASGIGGGIAAAGGFVADKIAGLKNKAARVAGFFGIGKKKVQPVYVVGGVLDDVKKLSGLNDKADTTSDKIITKISEKIDGSNSLLERLIQSVESVKSKIGKSASGIVDDVDGIGDTAISGADSVIAGVAGGKKRRVSRGPKIRAKADAERAATVARGSADAIQKRFDQEDAEETKISLLSKISDRIQSGNEENEKHHSVWDSIFGKKGLMIMALLAGFAFLKSEKFRNFIIGAITSALKFIPKILKDAVSGFVTSDRKDNKNGFVTEDGNVILDENGNPIPVDVPGEKSLLDAFMPKATRIDPKTGKAITTHEWSDKSGTAVNFILGRVRKPIKAAIKVGKGVVGGVKAATSGVSKTVTKAKDIGSKIINSSFGQKALGAFKSTKVGQTATKIASTAADVATSAKGTVGSVVSGAKNAVIKKKDDVISKFASLAKDAVKLIKDKLSGFLAKHGGKLGGTLLKFLDDIPKKLTGTVLGKFAKNISKAVSKVATSAGSLMLSDVAWGIAGAINTNPAQVFKVDSKDVDWKMQAIGRVIEGLLATSVGSIIDVIFEIISSISGFDVVQWICIQLYNLISSKKDEEELKKAQEAFKASYDEYSKKEYEAYVKNCEKEGIAAMSYEDYMDSGLGRSFDQYNQQQNKTLVQKVTNGVSGFFAKITGKGKDNGDVEATKISTKEANAQVKAVEDSGIGHSITKAIGDIGKSVSGFFGKITSSLGFGSKKDAKKVEEVGGEGGYGGRRRPARFSLRGGFGDDSVVQLPTEVSDVPSAIKNASEYSKLMYIAMRGLMTPLMLINQLVPRTTLSSVMNMVESGSSSLFSTIIGTIGSMAGGTVSKIIPGIKGAIGGIKNFASGVWNKAKDLGSSFLNTILGKNKEEDTSGGNGGFGGVPYYSQNDPSIAGLPYNLSNGQYDTMGNRGCGPTAMAMAMGGLGKAVSPMSMAQDATAGGYSTEVGTTPDFFSAEASKLGVSSAQSPATASNIAGGLMGGNPIIIQGRSSGGTSPFTSKGHYVVGTGVSGTKIAINDPRGPEFSGLYDISDVTKDATNMWSFGGYGGGKRPYGFVIPMRGGFGGVTPETVIKIAQGEVGYMEKASNAQLEDKTANVGDKNYTKYGVLTGTNGQPWCASFVCWCFVQACGGDRNKAKTMLYGNLWAGCDELMGNFKKAGRFDKKPQIGDVVMFGVPGDASHTGIVVGVNGNTITTIEGNTKGGVGLEREGNGVCIKTYDIATSGRILGFGHPAYEGTTSFAGINGTTMASTGTTGTTASTGYTTTASSTTGNNQSLTSMLSGFASAIFSPVMERFGLGSNNNDMSTGVTGLANETGDGGITTAAVSPDLTGDYIGKHVKQFESGSKGSAAISKGTGDYGGVSFGTYQFPSGQKSVSDSDSMLSKFWNTYYASAYPGVKPGDNQAFKDAWSDAVKKNPSGFSANEYAFMFPNYYANARDIFAKNGLGNMDDYDRAAQEALWSTTVQLGAGGPSTDKGAFALYKKAGVNTSMAPTDYINKLYDTKISNVPKNFKSSSAAVQESIKKRYASERNIMLGLVGKPKVDTSKYTTGGAGGFGGGTRANAGSVRVASNMYQYGGYGPADDASMRVIALLETIAEATTGTRKAVETLSAADLKAGNSNVTNNANTSYNILSADPSTKSRKLVPGKDRTGYALAKQLAKGTFAYG